MATKKAPATKKTPIKKAPTRKPAATKTTVKKTQKPVMRSFKRTTETEPFMTFRLTRQTLYWLIIAVMVVGFSVWIISLQRDIMALYDQVDQIRMSEPQLTNEQLKKLHDAKVQQQ